MVVICSRVIVFQGIDASNEFDNVRHSEEAIELLEDYYIGDLVVWKIVSFASLANSTNNHPCDTGLSKLFGHLQLILRTLHKYFPLIINIEIQFKLSSNLNSTCHLRGIQF
jgi:hypothetical protein